MADPGKVRRQDDGLQVRELGGVGRLGLEHVERRAGDRLPAQRLQQGRLVDQAAARGVDEQRCRLHQRQALGVDDLARRRDQRRVEGDDVGAAQQRVHRRQQLDAG